MSTEITNKTEAYDYLYDVSQGTIEANEQQIQKAKEFVSDRGCLLYTSDAADE